MNQAFENLMKQIRESSCITIFRHEHPDCDALGSQWALFTWISDNFPEKKVFALGRETTDQCRFPANSSADDETVRQSTAIVLDTANTARIDDGRALQARQIIKVDHHPNREPYGEPCIVVETAAATCEILADFFRTYEETCRISAETAKYLYRGLLTDTLCYRTSNTTPHTLLMGSFLASHGIDLPGINRELFDVSYDVYSFQNALRSATEFSGGIARVILSREDLARWNMNGGQARNHIDELGHVREFRIWMIFTESDEHPGLYHGSLRSKDVRINDIAEQYNGGGHPNASGVKNLSLPQIADLTEALRARLKEC